MSTPRAVAEALAGLGARVRAVVFLARPAAAFVTGVMLPVDGGYLVA